MHELGVVFYIIKDAKEAAINNGAKKIKSVSLNLGEVTTIIPYYLEDCWKWAVEKEEITSGCELKINKIPAITYCENCHKEYETVKFGKICPHCQSERTYLKQGNEVEIKEIEVI